jgi:hypothetical protein
VNHFRTRKKWQLVAKGSKESDVYEFETDSIQPKLVVFKVLYGEKNSCVRIYNTDIETARGYWKYLIAMRGAILTLKEETND